MKTMSYGQDHLSLIDKITLTKRINAVVEVLNAFPEIKARRLEVMDLGCGYFGKNLQVLAKQYVNALFEGIDLEVSERSEFPNVILIPGDISTWQPVKHYDIVLSLAVIEHLVDPLRHLKLIQSLLKPGGLAILTTPTPVSHFLWHMLELLQLIDSSIGNTHVLYITKSGIIMLAQKAGLNIVRQSFIELGLNQIVVFTRNEDNSLFWVEN